MDEIDYKRKISNTIGAEATYKNIWEAMMAMESQHMEYLKQFARIQGIAQTLNEKVDEIRRK